MDRFKTINSNDECELVEKKSKFIASIFRVNSIDEAESLIKDTKKKYYDARHNCYAYSVIEDEKIINRFSDDGEPSGTAGGPMLNILTGNNITNTLVIVTRYFGGILLGTGGLVRAYSDVTKNVIEKVGTVEQEIGYRVKFEVTYSEFEKLKYYLNRQNISIIDTEYFENIVLIADMSKYKYNDMKNNELNLNFKMISSQILFETFVKIIE